MEKGIEKSKDSCLALTVPDFSTVEIILPHLTPTTNELYAMHWKKRHRWIKMVKTEIWAESVNKRPNKPFKRAAIQITRHSSHEPDYDNLTGSMKMVIDALKESKIIEDDTPNHIEVTYLWRKAPRNEGKIAIVIRQE